MHQAYMINKAQYAQLCTFMHGYKDYTPYIYTQTPHVYIFANLLAEENFRHHSTYVHACIQRLHSIKLIAFELAGEDRDRWENPVLSRLIIAFFALHKRG
jgi:hypothetical protein